MDTIWRIRYPLIPLTFLFYRECKTLTVLWGYSLPNFAIVIPSQSTWFCLNIGIFNWIYQFSSVAQSCLTLCDPMNCSTPGLPVITNPRSSLKFTSIESVMPSSHLILCCPLLLLPQSLPASESFPMSQLFPWSGQSTGVSALASVLIVVTKIMSEISPLKDGTSKSFTWFFE